MRTAISGIRLKLRARDAARLRRVARDTGLTTEQLATELLRESLKALTEPATPAAPAVEKVAPKLAPVAPAGTVIWNGTLGRQGVPLPRGDAMR